MFDAKILLIVLAIALVLFGTKRLRSIGSDLGAGIKGLKEGFKEADEVNQELKKIPRD